MLVVWILNGLVATLWPNDSRAGWGPEIRLSNSSWNSYTTTGNARSVASDTLGRVHVLWADWDTIAREKELWYARSTDNGVTFETPHLITAAPIAGLYPFPTFYQNSITASPSGVVHITWTDLRDLQNSDIWFKRSTDGGATWSPDTNLTSNPGSSFFPSLSADGGSTVHLVWSQVLPSPIHISYRRSTDGGYSWSAEVSLAPGRNPTIIADRFPNRWVYAAWKEEGSIDFSLFLNRSSDGGSHWIGRQGVGGAHSSMGLPAVATDGNGRVHVLRCNALTPLIWLMYRGSTDHGTTWGTDTLLSGGFREGDGTPSAASDDSGNCLHTVRVLGTPQNHFIGQLWYRRLNIASGWESDTLICDQLTCLMPNVVADWQGRAHVVWCDAREGNMEVYYRRWAPGASGVEAPGLSTQDQRTRFELSVESPTVYQLVFRYTLPEAGRVCCGLYDVTGRCVKGWTEGYRSAGHHEARRPVDLAAGLYFLRLETKQGAGAQKIVVVR